MCRRTKHRLFLFHSLLTNSSALLYAMRVSTAFLLLAFSGLCAAGSLTDANIDRVDVDIFVMSKCPDAVYCESALSPVLQELKGIVSLNLHYIGFKQDDGSWVCKHGPSECDGDVQQLCVQLHSKAYQRYDWLFAYVLCTNQQGMDAQGLLSTATKCMKVAGIPLSAATKMLGCMYGPQHEALLQDDFAHTAALGISTSCTIQVEGNTVCVRDGGEWRDCPAGADDKDFREVLCAAYAAKNRGRLPAACRTPSAATIDTVAAAEDDADVAVVAVS